MSIQFKYIVQSVLIGLTRKLNSSNAHKNEEPMEVKSNQMLPWFDLVFYIYIISFFAIVSVFLVIIRE
jgi:heme/copper-type cytochrome/quinol oxidase subunit 2